MGRDLYPFCTDISRQWLLTLLLLMEAGWPCWLQCTPVKLCDASGAGATTQYGDAHVALACQGLQLLNHPPALLHMIQLMLIPGGLEELGRAGCRAGQLNNHLAQ
jgi:hypothetical protein